MSIVSAERMALVGGRQYHIGAAPGDVAPYLLLVGDPERAERAAARLSSRRFVSASRDYRIYTGLHDGLEISVMCVGMGAGCMEIAVVELCQIVEQPTMIRAGSAGSLQPDIALGDLVVTQGAVRMESASLGYVEPGFPAFAHAEVQLALIRAADEQQVPYHVGVTATAPGFFGAQGRSLPGFPPRDEHLLARLVRQGVKCLEMESSCLLTLAALRGFRAGAICASFGNRHDDTLLDEQTKASATDSLLNVSL
ncbi:MAG: Purine nucleoside phosphorylase, partial [Myxococcaceae bacterium]|nr:Purine nucleoside phosphorylase [Myxococcaceae bacterium]